MTNKVEGAVQQQAHPTLVEMLVLEEYDKNSTTEVLRFTNDKPVTWQGFSYQAIPYQSSGWEYQGSGSLPKPKIRISNVEGIFGALIAQYNDLVGAKLTRKRTLSIYLDGEPAADPTAHWPDEIFYINRKETENKEYIEFELASSLDLEGLELPRRRILRSVCLWAYRGADCGYTGAPVADINDNPTTDANLDQCGKRLGSCKLRFGNNGPLPFGGFPGAIRYR